MPLPLQYPARPKTRAGAATADVALSVSESGRLALFYCIGVPDGCFHSRFRAAFCYAQTVKITYRLLRPNFYVNNYVSMLTRNIIRSKIYLKGERA